MGGLNGATARSREGLLALDPELGLALSPDERAKASAALDVDVIALGKRCWDVDRLSGVSAAHVGLLLVDGVVAHETLVGDTVSTELLGAGDIIRPWSSAHAHLLQFAVRWQVLAPARAALIDRRASAVILDYPALHSAILDRFDRRACRLAISQAISQMTHVDRRLVAMLAHLAERWGRRTEEGIVLPLTLSHRMLSQLVGARRPTVSTAIKTLRDAGRVQRRSDGTWLLRTLTDTTMAAVAAGRPERPAA